MKILDALSKYIATQSDSLSSNYKWQFSLKKFPLANYALRGSNAYEHSLNLRTDIHNAIANKSSFSDQLQFWYVRGWGGVNGNKESTLILYVESTDSELFKLRAKGIATWSKILSVRDPSTYAVFDARVSLALNSLQKKYKVDDPVLFPLLPSQNRSFVRDATVKIKGSEFFTKAVDSDFYLQYIGLLKNATKNMKNVGIQDAEMILFTKSEELCSVWK